MFWSKLKEMYFGKKKATSPRPTGAPPIPPPTRSKCCGGGCSTKRSAQSVIDEDLVTEELDLEVHDPQQLAVLVLEFCKLTLPDLKYKEVAVKVSEMKGTNFPAFNGWWNPVLNQQIGYSLYE